MDATGWFKLCGWWIEAGFRSLWDGRTGSLPDAKHNRDCVNETGPSKSTPRRLGRLLLFVLPSFGYMGLRFLLNPLRMRLLTEMLPKELYGSLTLAVTTLTFIAILSSLGGFEFLMRRLPGLPRSLQRGWLHLIMSRLALPGWLLAGAAGAGAKALGWLPALSVSDLALLWSALGLTSWLMYRTYYSLGCGDLLRVRVTQLFQSDLWFILFMALGSWAAASLTNSLWVWTGWLAATAIGVRLWSRLPAEKTRPSERFRTVLHYGVPLLPMIWGEILFRLADRYVLLGFYDLKIVADYTLCINMAMMVYVMGISLLDLASPPLYAECNRQTSSAGPGPNEAMRRLFSAMMRHMWGIGLPAGFALAVFHRDIFHILSGPAFRDASVLLPWMAFIPFVYLTVTATSRALLAMNRPRLVGGGTLAAAGMNLGLDVLLAPRWGGVGIAVATVFSMAVLACALGWVLGWRSWLLRSELRPGSIVLATAICAAGFAALRWGFPGLNAWMRLLAGGLLAGGAVMGLRIFSPQDIVPAKVPPVPEADSAL